jgi:hypothetical protein
VISEKKCPQKIPVDVSCLTLKEPKVTIIDSRGRSGNGQPLFAKKTIELDNLEEVKVVHTRWEIRQRRYRPTWSYLVLVSSKGQ